MNIPKEPALLIGLVMALLGVVANVVELSSGGTVSVVGIATVVLPALAGILTRFNVIPVATVKEVVTTAQTAGAAVVDLADKVGAAVNELPADARRR